MTSMLRIYDLDGNFELDLRRNLFVTESVGDFSLVYLCWMNKQIVISTFDLFESEPNVLRSLLDLFRLNQDYRN